MVTLHSLGTIDKRNGLVSPFCTVLEVCCTLLCWFPSMLCEPTRAAEIVERWGSARAWAGWSWVRSYAAARNCFACSSTIACICSACDSTFVCSSILRAATFLHAATFAYSSMQMLGKVKQASKQATCHGQRTHPPVSYTCTCTYKVEETTSDLCWSKNVHVSCRNVGTSQAVSSASWLLL